MTDVRPWGLRDVLSAIVLFLVTADFSLWQNTRVAALWDISYLLDSAFRFTLGQLPYRDLPFPHAPLTFLIQAGIIEIFGRHYILHMFYAAFAGGFATLLAWRIMVALLRPLADGWLVATLLAAPLTLIGIYSIYPHPIYDSDCILSVLFAIYLLGRAHDSLTRNTLAGVSCVFPLFFKQNIGLPFVVLILAAMAAITLSHRSQGRTIRPQLLFFAGAFAMLAAALLTIQAIVGLNNYFYWTITFAAQRRLPGLPAILDIYRQTSLLWTIPAALASVLFLRSRESWAKGVAALLLASPFAWTVLSLALDDDSSDRANQLLTLWPHILILAAALALYNLRQAAFHVRLLLPFVLLATIHGTFLSQQLWGSTYAIWPLLILLIAIMLLEAPAIARPISMTVAATFLLCGGLYAVSLDRFSYEHLEGLEDDSTAPALSGLTTPGPWIPALDELVRYAKTDIPFDDGILILPGEDPFFFATGRTPQFPILLFDPATDPYTPQETLQQARARNIRWLIVNRNLQMTSLPNPDLPEIFRTLQSDFTLYQPLSNYNIYRRKETPSELPPAARP